MYTDKRCDPRKMRFPSPHSGILFLSAVILEESAEEKESFRPLIRGFFFYNKWGWSLLCSTVWFPSPHSGILFLYEDASCGVTVVVDGFRPLIRGFFFYRKTSRRRRQSFPSVSVPSFGDSFFMSAKHHGDGDNRVSVPSFGDSFFIINNEDINGVVSPYGFRPLIRGFFFYWCSLKTE